MKKIAIRFAFVVLLIIASFSEPSAVHGPIGAAVWDAIWALVFAAATVYFTGGAPWFAPLIVLMVSAVWPFAILCGVSLSTYDYDSWSGSAIRVASHMFHYDPLAGIALFVPTIITFIALSFFGDRLCALRAQ